MTRGSMLQRINSPHLTGPGSPPKEIQEKIDEYHREKENERDSGRYVQKKGGQSR
jgi:hypothetical protein